MQLGRMIVGGNEIAIQGGQGKTGKTQDKHARTQEPRNDDHVDDGTDGN